MTGLRPARDGAWVPAPGPRHRNLLDSLLAEIPAGANLIPDAHLTALATEHGLTLASTDGAFARFSGLRWVNPLPPR